MPRLVPNPIGDLMTPLQRIEGAIHSLAEKLRPVDSLPDVHQELLEVNRSQGLQVPATAAKARPARTRGAG
jgi:hypothetical protein